MTTQEKAKLREVDAVYKMQAVIGYMLLVMDDELKYHPMYKQSFKAASRNYRDMLVKQEQAIYAGADLAGVDVSEEMVDQQQESYLLVERLMNAHLRSAHLTEDAKMIMNDEIVGVLRKWGVVDEEVMQG
jgi:hypothetical protein